MSEKIKFLIARDVKSPDRAHATDAGIDFFVPVFNEKFIKDLIDKNYKTLLSANPKGDKIKKFPSSDNCSPVFLTMSSCNGEIYEKRSGPQDFFGFDIEEGEPYFILPPEKGVSIPSGVHCKMEAPGRMLRAANKSGVSSGLLLDITAEIVDHSYQGEIHIAIKNDSEGDVKIYQNMKLVQFIEMPIFTSEIDIEKDTLPLTFYGEVSERGEGAFGSTKNKK